MLIYHKDPKGLISKDKTGLDTSLSLFDNIKNNYPHGFNHEVTEIRINGEKIDPLTYDLSRKATILDEIVIINRQQGLETLAIASIIISIAGAVAAYLLMPDTDTTTVDTEAYSSNNNVSGQSNRARLYQAKPDIYGKMRIYPDIVNPASYEYIDNIKYIEHLFCVGIGEYNVTKLKYDETLLDNVSGTTYTLYKVGDTIPQIMYQFSSAEIDGQEITPSNFVTDDGQSNYYTNVSPATDSSGKNAAPPFNNEGGVTFKLSSDADLSYWASLPLPTSVRVKTNAYFIMGGDVETEIQYKYYVFLANLLSVDLNNKTITITEIADSSSVESADSNYSLHLIKTTGVYIDNYILPKKGSEIWVDLNFPNGLVGTVYVDFVYWQIDSDNKEIENTREKYEYSINLNTKEPQYKTIKINPSGGYKTYAIVFRRANDGKTDLSDQVKVERVSAVSYDYNVVAKDTLLHVKTKTTSQVAAFREMKINAVVNRKVITYNTSTKQIDYALKASRSFADAVLHTFIVMYKRDASELDLDALYSIDAKIKANDEKLGYFDYSFDDIDVSLGDRLITICNAARVYVYHDGQKWRFNRNEKKTRPSVMFNSLNLANSQSGGVVQKKSSLPTSYDGVQIEYVNSSEDNGGGTDKKAFVNLRIKDKAIVEEQAFRPLKIVLSGCRNKTQAMNRAQLEVRRLIYERTFVEDEAIADANLIDKGDLVLWADTYDQTIAQGEITSISNNQFYVDQVLMLDKDKAYRVSITDKYGYPSDWLTITSHDKQSFTANFDSAFIANGIDVQMGSIFIITEKVSAEPTEFLLTNKQYQDDGTFKINLTGYDSRVYDYD